MILDALEGGLGSTEGSKGEVETSAVVCEETEIAEGKGREIATAEVRKRVSVASTFGHFEAVSEEVLTVYPVADERVAGSTFALGNFVFVVRKDIVDTAGMNVEAFTEVTHAHSRAFDMPAREALTPRAGPFEKTARLGTLPEGEIGGVTFCRVGISSHTFEEVGELVA